MFPASLTTKKIIMIKFLQIIFFIFFCLIFTLIFSQITIEQEYYLHPKDFVDTVFGPSTKQLLFLLKDLIKYGIAEV